MSKEAKQEPHWTVALSDALRAYTQLQKQLREAEEARRKKLTPTQRATEDRAHADRERAIRNDKLAKPYKKMDSTILKRESWTIEKFSWLLVGENPDERGSWLDPETDSAADEQKNILSVLATCVDVGLLKPLNSAIDAKKLRFRTSDLISLARVKQLARYEVLQAFLPQPTKPIPQIAIPAPAPLPTNPPRQSKVVPIPKLTKLAKQGTATRELGVVKRRKQLVAVARELVAAGQGTESNSEIRLGIHGKDLNKRFRDKHTEWTSMSDKRLETDRAECKPPISVRTGRPRNPAQ